MTTQTLENPAPAQRAAAAKHLIFNVGEELYGLPVCKVREILRLPGVTAIPRMPAHIRGVVNLRGKIVAVLDLRIRFGLEPAQCGPQTCLVVAEGETAGGKRLEMGLVVDGVREVAPISAGDVQETPKFGRGVETGFAGGIAKVKGQVVALLELDRVTAWGPPEEMAPAAAAPGGGVN